jgi:hypothetical protein
MEVTSTSVLLRRGGAAVASFALASMIAITRSMPMDTPTAGMSLPANCPTMLSYLPPAAMLPT